MINNTLKNISGAAAAAVSTFSDMMQSLDQSAGGGALFWEVSVPSPPSTSLPSPSQQANDGGCDKDKQNVSFI